MSVQMKDKDAYQRLNYLYQAAHCVLSQNPENVELARFYCFTQKTIARRLVLRQDPSVKRTLCKKCCSLLVPGVTASTRQRRKNSKARFTVLRCLSCGQSRTLLNDPDHRLWVDRPEAQHQHQQHQHQQQQHQQHQQHQQQQHQQQQHQKQKQKQQPDPSVKKQPKDKKRGGSASSSKPGAAQSAAST